MSEQSSQQAVSRRPGTFAPGKSGNPGGRAKGIEALARAHTEEAIATLVAALKSPRERVAAAVALLDRGWGKPKQQISGDPENPLSYVIRAPAACETTEQWLAIYAPKTIDAEPLNEAPRDPPVVK
jgi:HEAT repeat protein